MASDGFEKITPRRIAGISARCANNQPETIHALWEKYTQQDIPSRLQGSGMYAVYFEYESDVSGQYTLLLGQHVEDDAPLPEGMRDVFLEPGDYAVFDAVGPFPESIVDTWSRVWSSSLQRTYRTDFEMYLGPERASIFVGAWENESVL